MSSDKIKVKPFLKWAGGKSQLISMIESSLPIEFNKNNPIENYIEPFIGGGALFFHLMSKYEVEKAYISDINEDLILTYRVIKNDVHDLIEILKPLRSEFSELDYESKKIWYYDIIRPKFNKRKKSLNYNKYSKKYIAHAADFIFLNKTCFNGLYRVNSNGEFNVPMGRYEKPLICDENNLNNISEILNNKDVTIENKSYTYCESAITDNSFVYLDPPYMQITKTSFTSYTKSNFNQSDHEKLAEFYKKISEKGVNVLLSNSNYAEGECAYKKIYGEDIKIDEVSAKRYINSDGKNRGPVKEILVRNYVSKKDIS